MRRQVHQGLGGKEETMSKSATLTVLSDNHTATRGMKAEHGFSCLVETAGANILFDSGAGPLFSENARALKIELYGIESIVLSHGHYDHADGLPRALFEAPGASLVLHKAALTPKMFRDRDGHMVHAGMSPETEKAIRKAETDGRASFIDGPVRLGPNVIAFPVGPRNSAREGWPYFTQTPDGRFEIDLFPDELCLLVLGDANAALVVGDAHNGLVKSYKKALELAGGRAIDLIVGGSCLAEGGMTETQATANFLLKTGARICLGHSTGLDGYGVLRRMLGPQVKPMRTGLRIEL